MDSPRRRGRPKKVNEVEQGATIGVLATALSAIFIIPSVAFGSHWVLSEEEANLGAESLQKALSRLPNNKYVDLKKYLDNIVPWVALAIVFGQIIAPRIEETQRKRAERSGEGFPSSIEVPANGYVDPAVRRGQAIDRDGPHAGNTDSFGAFPGAD